MAGAATVAREIPSRTRVHGHVVSPSLAAEGTRWRDPFRQFSAINPLATQYVLVDPGEKSTCRLSIEELIAGSATISTDEFTYHVVLHVDASLTALRDYLAGSLCLTDSMTSAHEFSKPRVEQVRSNPDLSRAIDRLSFLRSLQDGWLGVDSLAASEETGKEAASLLRKLAIEIPDAPLPVIGLDTDGTIVMTWTRDGLAGSLTIYGDGTYSYFVRRGEKVAKNPEARISKPLDRKLISLLAS